MLAMCRCLLRLWFRVCSRGLILLSGYACTRKKWFLDVFWVDGVKPCFVYGLRFVHMVCSCLLAMHVREKKENGFLLCFHLSPANVLLLPLCVLQNYTQRTI